jgi:large subunit ribosomal protein L20
LARAKGFRGARSKLFRTATEAVDRALRQATIHRRQKKRSYRSLWVTRISAACRQNGVRYSEFVAGLARQKILLNRKMLAEIAVHDPEGFTMIVERAKAGPS